MPVVIIVCGCGANRVRVNVGHQRIGAHKAAHIQLAALLEYQAAHVFHRNALSTFTFLIVGHDHDLSRGLIQLKSLDGLDLGILVTRNVDGKRHVVTFSDVHVTAALSVAVQAGKRGSTRVLHVDGHVGAVVLLNRELERTVYSTAGAVIRTRKIRAADQIDRAALDLKHAQTQQGEIPRQTLANNVERCIPVSRERDICAAVGFQPDAVALVIVGGADRIADRNGVFTNDAQIKGLFRLDRAAVIVSQRQRGAFCVIAPARAAAVLLHFHGICIANLQKAILVHTCAIRNSKLHDLVVRGIPIRACTVGCADSHTARFTGSGKLTAQYATVIQVQALGQGTLNDLKIPVSIIVIRMIVCASDACLQIQGCVILYYGRGN